MSIFDTLNPPTINDNAYSHLFNFMESNFNSPQDFIFKLHEYTTLSDISKKQKYQLVCSLIEMLDDNQWFRLQLEDNIFLFNDDYLLISDMFEDVYNDIIQSNLHNMTLKLNEFFFMFLSIINKGRKLGFQPSDVFDSIIEKIYNNKNTRAIIDGMRDTKKLSYCYIFLGTNSLYDEIILALANKEWGGMTTCEFVNKMYLGAIYSITYEFNKQGSESFLEWERTFRKYINKQKLLNTDPDAVINIDKLHEKYSTDHYAK